MFTPPHYPIVYIRGYAGTQSEVEDTVADPYMGFNVGSTKIRQLWTKDVSRHIFESPLIRLMKDHGYSDVYEGGAELPFAKRPDPKSIWIYRYYEPVSKDLGTGFRPEIEDYARGLDELIERMRDQLCGVADGASAATKAARKAFKVHLIAHSMGGLVVRCYLQNLWPTQHKVRLQGGKATDGDAVPVDKVFTYATPHGGIDLRLIGNIPSFLQFNNIENFNEGRMREYLKLKGSKLSVKSLGKAFPSERFFCLVGTNHRDYSAAADLARRAVGPMSDGLVQVRNAAVEDSPRAFVHRSHSGHYGIVNSEEGYQNLRRFLFGDARVDAFLDVRSLTLPPAVQKAKDKGKEVRASYHIEVIARVRGARWDLHRRTVDEESALFYTYDELVKQGKPVHLSSTFLLDSARVDIKAKEKPGDPRVLGFSLDLRLLVPEYVVDGRWFQKDHHEGGYLFRDKVNFELERKQGAKPQLRWGVDTRSPNQVTDEAARREQDGGCYEFSIPLAQDTTPGFEGVLRLCSQPWN